MYSPCNRQSATRRSRPRRARRRPRTPARPPCSTARARGTSPPSEATTAGPGTAAWDPPCPCPCQGPPALLPARPLPTPGARRPRPAAPPRRRAARLPGHPSGPPAPRPSPATPSRRRPQRGCRRGCVTRVGATSRCSGSGGGGGGSLGGARHGRGQSNSSEGHGRASPGGPLLDRKARSRSSTPPRGVRPDRAGAHCLDAVVEVGLIEPGQALVAVAVATLDRVDEDPVFHRPQAQGGRLVLGPSSGEVARTPGVQVTRERFRRVNSGGECGAPRGGGGGMAEGTASGVPREAFQPGDLAFPQISAPRARPSPPVLQPSKGNTPRRREVRKRRRSSAGSCGSSRSARRPGGAARAGDPAVPRTAPLCRPISIAHPERWPATENTPHAE